MADSGKRPTIVLVLASLDRGGTELNTLRSARVLAERGYRVEVFNIGRRGEVEVDLARHANIRHHPIRGFLSGQHLQARRAFRDLLRELDAPIVHAQDAYSAAFVVLLGRLPVRLVAVNRRWETTGRRWLDWVNRLAYARAGHVAVNARYLERRVRREVWPFQPRITLTPNFVEEIPARISVPAESPLRESLGIPPGAVILSCVARLAPFKRIDLLLEAAEALWRDSIDLHVLIAGSGEMEHRLREMAQGMGCAERIHFLGHVQDSRDVYEASDIAVLCSDREGMPNTLVEAAAVGRPLVASDVGGNPDIVVDGITGFLFARGAEKELRNRLLQLATDPELRQSMGMAARKKVSDTYTEQRYWQSLVELYQMDGSTWE